MGGGDEETHAPPSAGPPGPWNLPSGERMPCHPARGAADEDGDVTVIDSQAYAAPGGAIFTLDGDVTFRFDP